MTDHSEDIDNVSGTSTTGHQWDGIRELDTPLPRWWLITFYLTIVWAIGYWVLYPAWPLLALARARGKTVFGDNCAPCHGSGAAGAKGYPNLNDDDWLWGGTLDQIMQTIRYGARAGNAKTHEGQMLAFGKEGVLKPDQIVTVANYVRSLSGLPTRPGYDAAAGAKIFAENCTACHGENGKGNQELGAPDLTDKIWLYGSDEATIIETITNGRSGVMPAWEGRLDPVTLKAMAVYVHSLGGGK